MAAFVLSLGGVSVATAQDTGADVTEEATNDDGDTGLFGLVGLLGLAGLFGLRRDDDRGRVVRTDERR
jgi:MYXO-CTERM domain-containing protein